ncbi:MAG TPA: N-acetylglucosamine-6-phosphate deacetylase [Marmoricola sp.]|nr:N-acetylglucosamine-6-phosphate deacetylase [Marmoricola sp.]
MTALVVRGGRDASGAPLEVSIVDGVLGPGAPGDAAVVDATGLVVAPGLVDLQVNGAAGVDVTNEPERIASVGAELVRHGVTAYLPTVITSGQEARSAALSAVSSVPSGSHGAVALGVHFEGPMIAPSRRGAHPEAWLREPSLELVEGWSRDAGVVMVTIAPELPGACAVIASLAARGVVVSIGHTSATPDQVVAAVDAGARCATHLFNAMPPLSAREPGPVGAVLGHSHLVAGLIVDGIHLSDAIVRTAWHALGPERFWSVSDTTAALGLGDGPTRLGDQDVIVADGAVRLADGTLAGSASSLADCVRTLWTTTGCSLDESLATATSTPARLIGDDSRGRLVAGARGDLVLLDVDEPTGRFDVVATVVGGVVAFDRRKG